MITIYSEPDCPRCTEAVEIATKTGLDVLKLRIGDDPIDYFDKTDIMAFCQMNGSQLPVIQRGKMLMTLEDFKGKREEGEVC